MSATISCRLCLKACNNDIFEILYNESGQSCEAIYAIAIKFFHREFLTMANENQHTVICSICWHYIYEFHSFQQTILRAQGKLFKISMAADEADSFGPNSTAAMKIEKSGNPIDNSTKVVSNEIAEVNTEKLHDMETIAKYGTMEEFLKEFLYDAKTVKTDFSASDNDIYDQQYHDKESERKEDSLNEVKNKTESYDNSYTVEQSEEFEKSISDVFDADSKNIDPSLIEDSSIYEGVKTEVIDIDDSDSHPSLFEVMDIDDSHQSLIEDGSINARIKTEVIEIDNSDSQQSDEYEEFLSENSEDSSLKSCQLMPENIESDEQNYNRLSQYETSCDDEPSCSNKFSVAASISVANLPQGNLKQRQNPHRDKQIAQWRPALKCPLCVASCVNFSLLQDHFTIQHPAEKKCYIKCCNMKLKSRSKIFGHSRFHTNPDELTCHVCGQIFKRKDHLKIHMKVKHNVVFNPELSRVQRRTFIQLDKLIAQWKPTLDCPLCNEGCPNFKSLQKHFSAKHPAEKLCYILCCNRKLPDRSKIDAHRIYHMKLSLESSNADGIEVNQKRSRQPFNDD